MEYDGTRYKRWQEQKNARTVMGELRKAALRFSGKKWSCKAPAGRRGCPRPGAGGTHPGRVSLKHRPEVIDETQ